MKKLISLILIVSFYFAIQPMWVSSAISTNLEACWTLDEESGTRVDSTTANVDLTDNNTVLFATGIQGNAAQFEEDTFEYLSAATSSDLIITGDLSVAFWYKHETDLSNNTGWYVLFRGIDGGNSSYAIQHFINVGTPQWIFLGFTAAAPTNNINLRMNFTHTAGTFYHVVITYDTSETQTELFIDGTSITTTTNAGLTDLNGGNLELHMGSSPVPSEHFDGLLDEFGIWSKVLTQSEINDLYNGGLGVSCEEVVASAVGVSNSQVILIGI